ncbi:hypothetical protein BJF78_09830 [Pseudonocardia sp. CNS-139]|nr:hypothetical protein BJF78_09830 [Pseudonocardia sp. CNS-139]
MTAMRPPGPSGAGPDCALVAGADACRCAHDAPFLTDDQIIARAMSMLRWEQRASPAGKHAARTGLDALLEQARGRGPSTLVAELLRMCVMVRILGADPADAEDVETLLAELIEIAELDGDPRRLGDAATLRAHRTAVFGQGENALATRRRRSRSSPTSPRPGPARTRRAGPATSRAASTGSCSCCSSWARTSWPTRCRSAPSRSRRRPGRRWTGSCTSSTGSGCSCRGRCGWNAAAGTPRPPPGSSARPRPRRSRRGCGRPRWPRAAAAPARRRRRCR